MTSAVVTLNVLAVVAKVQVELGLLPLVLLPKVPSPRSVLVVTSKKSTLPWPGAALPLWAVTVAVKVTAVP